MFWSTYEDKGLLLASSRGSHMPLDVQSHWSITNPLNLLLVLFVFLTVMAIVGVLV